MPAPLPHDAALLMLETVANEMNTATAMSLARVCRTAIDCIMV